MKEGYLKKASFHYRVRDKSGKVKQGKAIAATATQVQKTLTGRGYDVLSITEDHPPVTRFLSGHVSAKDRSIMYRELSTMLRAGVGITQAIDIVAEAPNKQLRRVLMQISISLQNGFPLSVAMTNFPRVFPPVETGVIRAGEATGNLAQVLKELSRSTARSAEFTGRVRGALIYPLFVVGVMIIIGIVLMTKVIPPIKEIFISTGTSLPFSTRLLLNITDAVINHWGLLVGGVIFFLVLLRLWLLTKPGKKMASLLSLNFPVFGQLMQQVYLARFNRTLALLVGAGVPIIESVEIIIDSTSDVTFNQALRALMHSLEQGSPISSSLQGNRYFPKLMTQLLFVGQQSGDLGGTAGTLADYFETEVDSKLRTFSALLEPFIIVILGLTVGFVVISVLQPIYSLSGAF